jgi:hypothetical protein
MNASDRATGIGGEVQGVSEDSPLILVAFRMSDREGRPTTGACQPARARCPAPAVGGATYFRPAASGVIAATAC